MKKMKKLLLLGLLAVLAIPLLSLSQSGPATSCNLTHDVGVTGCPAAGVCNFDTNSQCGMCCVLNAVYTVTDWVFFLLVAVVSLLVIYGGFTIATAGGAPEKVNSGRGLILWAMIGFAVALLARAIPSIVKSVLGVT